MWGRWQVDSTPHRKGMEHVFCDTHQVHDVLVLPHVRFPVALSLSASSAAGTCLTALQHLPATLTAPAQHSS